MTKIKGQEYLDAALKDVDQVNAEVFKGLGEGELFEDYQPAIIGTAGLIELYRKDFLIKAKSEAEETQYSEGIISEATRLEHTLEDFNRTCPDKVKPQCQHACEQLKAFLNANVGLFSGMKSEEVGRDLEGKPENLQKSLDKGR